MGPLFTWAAAQEVAHMARSLDPDFYIRGISDRDLRLC
jgi:hypothetical protein